MVKIPAETEFQSFCVVRNGERSIKVRGRTVFFTKDGVFGEFRDMSDEGATVGSGKNDDGERRRHW